MTKQQIILSLRGYLALGMLLNAGIMPLYSVPNSMNNITYIFDFVGRELLQKRDFISFLWSNIQVIHHPFTLH